MRSSDWRTSSALQGLTDNLKQQSSLTALIQKRFPDNDIISVRLKDNCLHVLVPADTWTVPLKDSLYQCLPDIAKQLSVQLSGVKVNRCLAESLES